MFVNVYFIESEKRLKDAELLPAILSKLQQSKTETDVRRMITIYPDSMSADYCVSINVNTPAGSKPEMIFQKAQEEVRGWMRTYDKKAFESLRKQIWK